jgi:hypothetical protein
MRFTSDNVNLEELQKAMQTLSGESSQLQLITRDDLDQMVELFSNPVVYSCAHMRTAPSKEELDDLMHADFPLLMWRVFPFESAKPGALAGYVAWVNDAGPPFLAFMPNDPQQYDVEVFRDAGQLVLKLYFTLTPGDELLLYVDRPVSEETHDLLTEAGFDLWTKPDDIDSEEDATYIMERATFQAYYADNEDEND